MEKNQINTEKSDLTNAEKKEIKKEVKEILKEKGKQTSSDNYIKPEISKSEKIV
jgi:hypothetical protein